MIRLRFARPHLLSALALCVALLVLVPTAIAADAGLIAFQGNRRDSEGNVEKGIFTMAPNGTGVKRLGDGFQPAISRNGEKIAFVRQVGPDDPKQEKHAEIFTMDADGGNVRQLTHDNSTDSEPALSPDGKQVVFVGNRRYSGGSGEPDHIFIVNSDGSGMRQLTKGNQIDLEPSFSPNGNRIVFVRGAGESQLVTMTTGAGDVTQLTKNSDPFAGPQAPTFSPDGKRILFQAVAKGNGVFTIDATDGRDLVEVTKGEDEGVEPAYSPEGGTIVFRRGVNLFTMGADGRDVNQLTDFEPQDGSNIHPSWGR